MSRLPIRSVRVKTPWYSGVGKWLKEWIPLPLSFLAIFMSGSQYYFTFLHHVDELRVVPDPIVPLIVNPHDAVGTLPDGLQIVFINSGNRAMAVLNVILEIGANDNCGEPDVHVDKNGKSTFPITPQKGTYECFLCLRFNLATPSDASAGGRISVNHYTFTELDRNRGLQMTFNIIRNTSPKLVWHASGFIWSD
jgi:hypothetical protein